MLYDRIILMKYSKVLSSIAACRVNIPVSPQLAVMNMAKVFHSLHSTL